MAKFRVFDIQWDFDDEEASNLMEGPSDEDWTPQIPTETTIELDDDVPELDEEAISDIIGNCISEQFGFCHYGFNYELINEGE